MKRRKFLKSACAASLAAAGVMSMLTFLVRKKTFASMVEAKEAFQKSPFTVFEKALSYKYPVTPGNVLGRPPAIDIRGMSTDEISYVPTACWQCVSRCGAVAVVENGRIKRMEGNPNLPRSNGKLCAKGRAGHQHVYDPDRLLYPMRRAKGTKRGEDKWERITWDEALNELATRLKKLRDEGHPEKLMFHYGRMKASSSKMIKSHFLAAFGTKTIGNHTAICEGAKWTAQELTWGKHYDVNDVANTNFILNFGCNVIEAHTSHIPFAQRVISAVAERDVPMYTFDVRLSNTAVKSTKWIPIRPGTDLAVVLAMAHVVIQKKLYDKEFLEKWSNVTVKELQKHLAEYTPKWAEKISGVPAATISSLAISYAKAKPGTIISYRGVVAHYNGVETERAIMMLETLCGYINVKGGRLMAVGGKWKNSFKKPKGKAKKIKVVDGEGYAYPIHHASQDVLRMIKEGKHGRPEIYMMYCYTAPYANGNCKENIEILKDESLIPYVVSIDTAYGEGTKYADLVLPDTNYLERWDWEDMVSYDMIPEFYIRQPVVAPPKEVRDFKDVIVELAHRIGIKLPFSSAEEFVKDACEHTKDVKKAGGFEYMTRYGAWYNRNEKPHYNAHAKVLGSEKLKGTIIDGKTGVIWKGKSGQDYTSTKNAYKKYVGQMINGVPYKGFKPDKLNKSGLIEIRSAFLAKKGFSALPAWMPIPEHKKLASNQLILTTFKVNVQTHSRSQNNAFLSEIHHENPAWINSVTARKFGIKSGDKIKVTSNIGSIVTKALVREGIVPGVVAISHHCGHWAYGRYATAGAQKSPLGRNNDPNLARIWWKNNGVHPNWIIPNKGDPISGQQRWMDTVVTIKKI